MNKPLSKKKQYHDCEDFDDVRLEYFNEDDVKQAVKEAYEELSRWHNDKEEIEILNKIFKDKFGFDMRGER